MRQKYNLAKVILTMALMLVTITVSAQDVSVMVTKVKQSLPMSFAELIDQPNRYVNVALQNNTNRPTDVYLKMSLISDYALNGTPMSLLTKENGNTRPRMTLGAYEHRQMNNIMDFSDHFSGRLTTNVTENITNIIRIPEGTYQFCIEVYRWQEQVIDDGEPMSRACVQFEVCYSGSAPEILTPITAYTRIREKADTKSGNRNKGHVKIVYPRNIDIRWSPVITNCASSAKLSYTLKMVKVMPGQTPDYAIEHSAVVFSKTTTGTYVQIDTLRNLDVPLERGAVYAVQVVARDKNVNNPIEIANDGKSQVQTFSWGPAKYNVDNSGPSNQSNNTAQQNTTETSDRDEALASIRQPYFCFPYRDEETYNAVRAKFSDEATIVPAEDKSVQVKFNDNYNDHIVSTAIKPFDIKWMPMRGETLTQVDYTVKLYDDLGAMSDLDSRTPLATKTFKKTASASGHVDNSNDPMSIGDTTWKRFMQQGKKYIVTVATSFSYRYMDYTINETKHYVNGIEADTEYDTVKVTRSASGSFLSTMKFQWGVDSTLLDRVLPPQFTTPVSRSTANWDDTTWLDFETAPIEELYRYDDVDLYFTWKPASNLNAKDKDSARYNLYFYEYASGKTLKEIIAGKAKFHKDSIADIRLVHDIIDSLKNDKNYVARVKLIIPDTTGYVMCNSGWSHPISFRFKKDTNDYSTAIDVTNACFARDTTGLSKKLIHPKVDSLINNMVKLKMGRFNLVVQKGKKDNKDRYSGEGYVEWLPLDGYGCGIKVKFDTLKINENLQVVSGTARSITQDSNNYLNLNMGNNKWGAGFDMYSDKGVQLLLQKAGELGSTGDEIKKWYNRINEYANPVAQLTHALINGGGAVSVITTPVKVSDAMLGGDSVENLSVAVNDFFFSPVTAQMNLLAIFASHEDNLYLPFLATNICIEPDKFFSDSVGEVNLFMGMDVDMELSDGYTMSFKRPTKLTDMSDGCHITFNKDGFKEIAVDAELFLGPKNQPGSKFMAVDIKGGNITKPDHPARLFFYTKFKSWSDWIAQVGMDPFMVTECGDFVFVPTGSGIWYDHSKSDTPKQVKFPQGYLKDPKQSAKWQGFYLDEFSVAMPHAFSDIFRDLTGEEGTPQAGAAGGGNGAPGNSTGAPAGNGTAPAGNTNPTGQPSTGQPSTGQPSGNGAQGGGKDKPSGGGNGAPAGGGNGAPGGAGGGDKYNTRINLAARQLILDKDGISVDISFNNLLAYGNSDEYGWYFSLDQLGVKFQKSEYKEGYINGKMSVPFLRGKMNYNCSLGTDSIDFAITPPGADKCAAAGGNSGTKGNKGNDKPCNQGGNSGAPSGNPGAQGGKPGATGGASGAAEKLTLTLFVADIDLACNSHFRIVYDESGKTLVGDNDEMLGTTYYSRDKEGTTRVDLTLHGTISLDSLKEKFKVPIKLPGIKFQNMYLRNYTTDKVYTGTDKGKPKTETAYIFDDWAFNIGDWSLASPQKYIDFRNDDDYTDREVSADEAVAPDAVPVPPAEEKSMAKGNMGAFSYNLKTISPFSKKGEGNNMTVGIKFDGEIGLGFSDGNIGGGCGFDIWCDVNTKTYKPESFDGKLNKVSVKSDIGPLHLEGMVDHDSTADLGDYWKGSGKVKFMEVVELDMGFGFGSKLYHRSTSTDDDGNQVVKDEDYFNWWYVECALLTNTIPPIGPVQITGLGGAFAYNMHQTVNFSKMDAKTLRSKSFADEMVSSSGVNFRPQRGAWVARAGVSLALAEAEKTMNADGILNLRVANGHFSGITLQVNAHILSDFTKADAEHVQESKNAAIDVASFIDYTNGPNPGYWKLNFAARIDAKISLDGLMKEGCDTPAGLPKTWIYPTSSDDSVGGAPLVNDDGSENTINGSDPRTDSEVSGDKTSGGDKDKGKDSGKNSTPTAGMSLQIPIEFAVEHNPGQSGADWYFAIGRPAKEDRVRFSANLDAVVFKAGMEFSFYFMFGNKFPGGYEMPDIDPGLDAMLQKAGSSRYNKFKRNRTNFKIPSAGGLALGGAFEAHMELDMLLYLNIEVALGFDLALLDVNGQGCGGYSHIGKNDFYGMGQIYAHLKGAVGFSLNLGFWKGRLILAESELGAILSAGGPKPTWAYGMLAFQARCLGGLIKINTSVDFEMGRVCVPGNTDPLANAKLFQNVTPAFTKADVSKKKPEEMVSPYSHGTITSNLPWNEDVMLCADDKYGDGTTTRRFRFVLTEKCSAQTESTHLVPDDDNTGSNKSVSAFLSGGKKGTSNKGTTKGSKMGKYRTVMEVKDVALRFWPDHEATNVQHFDCFNGFPESTTMKVYLEGRAFEKRPTNENDLSKEQKSSDSIYSLSDNGYTVAPADPQQYDKYLWHDPVFTDREKTTHKKWTQDTLFYFNTEAEPPYLFNSVVFSWPYNGDPHVPYKELRYDVVLKEYQFPLYLFSHKQFLLDTVDYKIKPFLVVKSANSESIVEGRYKYRNNGGTPQLVICFKKAKINFASYKGKNAMFAIHLMKADDDALNGAMARQVEEQMKSASAMMQTTVETERQNNEYAQRRTELQRQYTSAELKNNTEYQQLQHYANRNKKQEGSDTLMSFSRKSMSSQYDAYVASGSPIYTLYFAIDKYESYEQILKQVPLDLLFDDSPYTGKHVNRDNRGNVTSTSLIRGGTNSDEYWYELKMNSYGGGGDEDAHYEAGQYSYLFTTYRPEDTLLYHIGTTLPAIITPCIDYGATDGLYDIYAGTLVELNEKMKATYPELTYPKKSFKISNQNNDSQQTFSTYKIKNGVDEKTQRVNGLKSVFSQGIQPNGSGTPFAGTLNIRMVPGEYGPGGLYTTVAGSDAFPQKYYGGWAVPNVLTVEVSSDYPQWRIDSAAFMGDGYSVPPSGYSMFRNYPEHPWEWSAYTVKVRDRATPAMYKDYKLYRDFYQDLFDFGVWVHTLGYDTKINLLKYWNQYNHENNQMATSFPYTLPKSVLMNWWLKHMNTLWFRICNHSGKYDSFKYDHTDINDTWQEYVLHFDELPYTMYDKSKGTLCNELFSSNFLLLDYGKWANYTPVKTEWFNRLEVDGKESDFHGLEIKYSDLNNRTAYSNRLGNGLDGESMFFVYISGAPGGDPLHEIANIIQGGGVYPVGNKIYQQPIESNYKSKSDYKNAAKNFEDLKNKYRYVGNLDYPLEAHYYGGLMYPLIEKNGKVSKQEKNRIEQRSQDDRTN